MASSGNPPSAGNSSRLAALLDKLVAVDLDLAPICGEVADGPLIVAADAIADACDVLRSAIADLRNIIHQVDGVTDLPLAASANADRRGRLRHDLCCGSSVRESCARAGCGLYSNLSVGAHPQ